MRRRVRTPRSEKKKRDLAEQKIDQEIALINANLSMRKCMSSLDRLEKENRMLRNQFLQRLLIGNRKKIRNAFETWRWVDFSRLVLPTLILKPKHRSETIRISRRSMRKCIELIRRKLFHTLRMCRLSKGFETWKLFTKADILQRNLDAERISAWIQLNNDRRDAMDEHREKCLLVVLKRKNLIELREAWERWQELGIFTFKKTRCA